MLSTHDLHEAAQQAAGNWQQFDSFVWWRKREIDDPQNWAIFYTQHRDSGLLDQSNAAVISKALEPFALGDDPDLVMESHNHWAVGYIDGFSIRVFDSNGEITEAFRTYHELAERLDDCPILDESDYSERELEATLENIESSAWRLKSEFLLPDDWVSDVYDWLSDNKPSELENVDDQGGFPSDESLKSAFVSLGFEERP
jgi:hypothetical protein